MDSGVEKGGDNVLEPISIDTDTRDILAHARSEADKKNFDDMLIVDIDAHHNERLSWDTIIQYIDDPVIRHTATEYQNLRPGSQTFGLNVDSGMRYQDVGGRIPHQSARREIIESSGEPNDVVLARRAYESMGIDYTVIFPTPMLFLGIHPQVEMEVALGRAYNRWLCDEILSADDKLKAMLFLPFNDPKASLEFVREFAGKKGVIGFMVTSTRYRKVHHNDYMPLYAELQERGLPLSFHASSNWGDRTMSQFDRFISMHAISFVLCNIVHMTNWVLSGLPERFPNLDVIWIESGLAWIPFLMQRLDNEYMMRSSEAPLLKRRPGDYIREMYFSCQPMELGYPKAVECTFDMINAETQLLFASDWPHWDFDTPSVIYDLPFLSEQAKRNILGLNAKRLFKL
ncbi:MAG: amidohydrolase family protein [Proteobacteria bacterium]|nr:amidohydrolase family protein [Pseudomonadota bacterium]